MTIRLSKFGVLLTSRPAGREAYLSAKAYLLPQKMDLLEFDFTDVKVLTPSWIDEFITLFRNDYPKTKIVFKKSDNQSVISSLKILSPV